jgi:predicted metalloprotease
MTKWTCAHGFGLSERCRECDTQRAREIVERWGAYVDESRMVIAEAERARIRALPSLKDKLIDEGMDADVAHERVRQLIEEQEVRG